MQRVVEFLLNLFTANLPRNLPDFHRVSGLTYWSTIYLGASVISASVNAVSALLSPLLALLINCFYHWHLLHLNVMCFEQIKFDLI